MKSVVKKYVKIWNHISVDEVRIQIIQNKKITDATALRPWRFSFGCLARALWALESTEGSEKKHWRVLPDRLISPASAGGPDKTLSGQKGRLDG